MKRNEVPVEITWNLTDIFEGEEAFEQAISNIETKVKSLSNLDIDNMQPRDIAELLDSYEKLLANLTKVHSYASLAQSVDKTNTSNNKQVSLVDNLVAKVLSSTSYIKSGLLKLDNSVLLDVAKIRPDKNKFINDLIRFKPFALSEEAEKTLSAMSSLINLPYSNYNMAKFADLRFKPFKLDGKTYPLDYVLYEDKYQYEVDKNVRRTAFKEFSKAIKQFENTNANNYVAYVNKDKVIADLRGFKSVFDYLLHDQEIDRKTYDKHIDTVMKELSPVMQKYAKFLKKHLKLDTVTFADLKTPIDPEFKADITLEEGIKTVDTALKIMGEEYSSIIHEGLYSRWADFAQNDGKSTGAFCDTPPGVHPYILVSWTGELSNTFTLAHEFGHAVHFYMADENQKFLSREPSLYFIEAPSTLNELIIYNHFISKEGDKKFKRYCSSSLLGNTYYHNFVTHFIESYYQREVYRAVDNGQVLAAEDLNKIMKDTLKKFWGESVYIDDYAALTWMRQPHYYMGLYSYTYSAGLTISTNVYNMIKEKGKPAIENWINVLKSGGTKTPKELAKMAGVDISKTEALSNTIKFIESLVDDVIALS